MFVEHVLRRIEELASRIGGAWSISADDCYKMLSEGLKTNGRRQGAAGDTKMC